jgi:hypothetical protein
MGGTTGISQPPNAASGPMSCLVIIRNGIQHAVTSPSPVPASHSTQPMPTAVPGPSSPRPRMSVPAPTVISAIGGAPQNCAITGLAAWPRARSGHRTQCTAQAAVSAVSATAAMIHTTVAKTRSPGMLSGRLAPAMATMPVPMTAANQFGPRSRNRCSGRSSSFSRPNGMWRDATGISGLSGPGRSRS